MNLGEFIIKIGTKGDTKALDDAIKKMTEAEKKTRRQIKLMQDLAKATSDEERALIQKNAAQQDELEGLRAAKQEHEALNSSMQKGIATSVKMVGAIAATIVALDRLGNSLIQSNQQYITFERQTGLSITRLNKMAGIAQMATTGMSPGQVAGDIASLQQKIFGFERFGENARTFGMLGINPRGMKADQLILSLRRSLKGYSADVKSFYLSQLGLSQEWLNVIDLTDEKFNEYVKSSKKLQLTEKERKQLAEYTAKQQQNNMRWELAKQRLLLSVMPLVQQIMEITSKVALKISTMLEKNPAWLKTVKDILILLSAGTVLKTLSTIGKFLGATALGGLATGKALGRVASRKGLGAALGMVGKRLLGGASGFLGGPVIGAIFTIASAVMIIKDIYDLIANWFGKKDQEENEDLSPDPDEGGNRYQYHNVRSNMTNNFYNNPQPAKEAMKELSEVHNLILAEQYR